MTGNWLYQGIGGENGRNRRRYAPLWSEMARRKSKPQPVCMRDMYLYDYNLIRLHMIQETGYTKEMVAKMDEIADDIRRVRVEDK